MCHKFNVQFNSIQPFPTFWMANNIPYRKQEDLTIPDIMETEYTSVVLDKLEEVVKEGRQKPYQWVKFTVLVCISLTLR